MMASTSSSGRDTSGKVIAAEDQPVRPSSEHIQEIPHGVCHVTQPSSMLHSLGTWLLAVYLRYTCGILGYLTTCQPPLQVNQHEEVDDPSNALNRKPGVNQERGVNQESLTVEWSTIVDSEYVLEPKHKEFLSHGGAQKDFVEQLCVDLQRLDRYPFFYKLRSSLPVEERFPKLIFDAINQCQVGVLVLFEEFSSRASGQCWS